MQSVSTESERRSATGEASRRAAVWSRLAARHPAWRRKLAVVGGSFVIAFFLDRATDQRFSQFLGSVAILVSLLGLWPRARLLAVPIGVYAGVWIGFNLLRAIADDVPWRGSRLTALPNLETQISGGTLPSIRLQRRFFDPMRIDWLDWTLTLVYLSFFVVPHLVALILLVRNRDRFWRYVTASALLFLIGAVCFALLPTNPPWLVSTDVAGGHALRIINLTLANAGLLAHPGAGEGTLSNNLSFEPNPVATIPSIHLGVTALLVPLAATSRWRAGAVLYTLAMAIALVYLGEHYVIDVAAGAGAAALAWAGQSLLIRRLGDRWTTAVRQ